MKLSLREKQNFYYELGRFVQSGIPLPEAVESLAVDSRGAVREVLRELLRLFLGGENVVSAFAHLQPTIGAMEVALVEASERSGRLEQAFQYLTGYFDTLATVREGILKRAWWPVLELHIGVIVLNFAAEFLAGAISGSGFRLSHFLADCLGALGVFYALIVGGILGGAALARAAQSDTTTDGFLARLPVIGKLRRHLALSRFCAAYEMQLSAGVNVVDGVRAAGAASQSARIRAAVERMAPEFLRGASMGTLIGQFPVFPQALVRAIKTGEMTGSLDADLHRWAEYHQAAAVDALDAAGKWVTRLVTAGIMLYLSYRIVTTYAAMVHGVYEPLLNG